MKRIICILLIFLLAIPSTIFARADKYTTYTDESRLYAVVNEDIFREFFGVSPDGLNAYHELRSDDDLDEIYHNRLSVITYSFDIDGTGNLPSVKTTGYNDLRSASLDEEYMYYTAAATQEANINGRELIFYLLINYYPDYERLLSVNVSVCDKDEPDKFTHFTIGEPFLSQDMTGAWTEYDHRDERGLYYPEYDPTYAFIEETTANFNSEVLRDRQSQALETSYNASNNMLKTQVTTNARAVDEHFSKTGVSHTKVAEISITIEADKRLFPRIGNLHYFYDEIGGKEVSPVENKFRWYYILPMFYYDLFDYLEENAMHRHIPEYDDLNRTDTLILKKSHSVEFDDEPYVLEYRLDSPFLTKGRFKVSSHVVYHTFYTPRGTDHVVCYVTDGGTAETQWEELYVR